MQRERKDEAAAPRHAPCRTIEFAGGFPSHSFTRGSRRKGVQSDACVRKAEAAMLEEGKTREVGARRGLPPVGEGA